MSTNGNQLPTPEDQTPLVSPGNYSPVTVTITDSFGAIFLGILTGILLVGWIRAEARNRVLITQLERTIANHSPNAE